MRWHICAFGDPAAIVLRTRRSTFPYPLTSQYPNLVWRFISERSLRLQIMATKRSSKIEKRLQRARKSTALGSCRVALPQRTRAARYVYYFGDGHADGRGTMKALLGGKGANLHEMTRIGLPGPPGFSNSTYVCIYFYDHNRSYPKELQGQVATATAKIEKSTGKKFADQERP